MESTVNHRIIGRREPVAVGQEPFIANVIRIRSNHNALLLISNLTSKGCRKQIFLLDLPGLGIIGNAILDKIRRFPFIPNPFCIRLQQRDHPECRIVIARFDMDASYQPDTISEHAKQTISRIYFSGLLCNESRQNSRILILGRGHKHIRAKFNTQLPNNRIHIFRAHSITKQIHVAAMCKIGIESFHFHRVQRCFQIRKYEYVDPFWNIASGEIQFFGCESLIDKRFSKFQIATERVVTSTAPIVHGTVAMPRNNRHAGRRLQKAFEDRRDFSFARMMLGIVKYPQNRFLSVPPFNNASEAITFRGEIFQQINLLFIEQILKIHTISLAYYFGNLRIGFVGITFF